MNEPTPLELMQFADGESSPEDAERIARWLESSTEGRGMLAGLTQVGEAVRTHAEHRTAGFDVADSVIARLEERPRASRRVVPLFAAVTTFAAAAAAALLLRYSPERRIDHPSVATVRNTASSEFVPPAAPVLAEEDDGAPGAEVEAIDFGGESGTIFMVQGGADRTPVVWLVDEGDASGRMESL